MRQMIEGEFVMGVEGMPQVLAFAAQGKAHREVFRDYALDGALLRFHPASGTQIRIESEATQHLRREVPRVVMFGITNHCNLSCDFCSRDVSRDSAWTASSAAQVLRDLSAAGVLEVAFGGGEPFAFRGFADLVEELYETTALALNVTTNGLLIREGRFARYAGHLGQVRSTQPGMVLEQLKLAAQRRGTEARYWVNETQTLAMMVRRLLTQVRE